MTRAQGSSTLTQISEPAAQKFLIHSALLYLIDPVRGEPVKTLCRDNLTSIASNAKDLKKKFLDSFALICSTSQSGKETASAVCLEEDPGGAGSILRVARNRGLTPVDQAGLEKVLQVLRDVAKKIKSSTQAEAEVLRLVAELDRDRISSMANKVEKWGIKRSIQEAQSRLPTTQLEHEKWAEPSIRAWLRSCPFPTAAQQAPADTVHLINWASQTRWTYSDHLRYLLGSVQAQEPRWQNTLYKIARYHSAVKSLVKLAAKQPEIFWDIQIQALSAPPQRLFSLPVVSGAKAPLRTAVRNLVRDDADQTMELLEKHLATQDAEKNLRKACRLQLTLHAEMQLVVFYEGSPGLVPRTPFIGTSKKACFLCHQYLLQHPLQLKVSACHQKLYPSWMPPPFYSVSGKGRSVQFLKLGRKIEQLTRKELKTRLTASRRPTNQDSTAGPPLTLTATISTGPRS